MTPELGHFALALALVVSLIQAIVPMVGATRQRTSLMAVAEPAAILQLVLISIAFLVLTAAFVTSDFSVRIVVENSHSLKPLLYKVTGVWGNHEGSMLLWVLILSLFGAAVAWFGGALPPGLRARTLSIQGMIGAGFLAFILATSNPFGRMVPAPIEGMDLNPLLQDPGLAFHPPFLYLGYVGFSMAFSFAVAALIEGKVDPAWARWVRPWTLAAWASLTLGIALGSWWAYYELGWGGWWFWDPVENASLMPWLAGTALLHSAIVVEKRDALKSWTILLAILTFALSLLGTFLVRSGVLTSVHAFAVDPERGVFILGLLALTIGGALVLYAWRAPSLAPGGMFRPVSREGALVLNNLLLSTATATVLIGTLYPIALDALELPPASVGPQYFHQTFVPLTLPAVVAMGIGPLLAWKRGDLLGALDRLKFAAVLTLTVVALTAWIVEGGPVLALVGIAAGSWAIFAALTETAERVKLGRVTVSESLRRAAGLPRSAWGAMLAHLGLGVAILGMTGSLAWVGERIEAARPGDTLHVGPYEVIFLEVRAITGPNWTADEGVFEVRSRDGEPIGTLHAQRRIYPAAGMPTTEAAIRTSLGGDLYAVLGEPNSSGTWTVRLWFHPLVPWIWYGALIMAAGGALSLSDRRLRIGVPSGRAARAARAVPAE